MGTGQERRLKKTVTGREWWGQRGGNSRGKTAWKPKEGRGKEREREKESH